MWVRVRKPLLAHTRYVIESNKLIRQQNGIEYYILYCIFPNFEYKILYKLGCIFSSIKKKVIFKKIKNKFDNLFQNIYTKIISL